MAEPGTDLLLLRLRFSADDLRKLSDVATTEWRARRGVHAAAKVQEIIAAAGKLLRRAQGAAAALEVEPACQECGASLVLTGGWGACPNGHGRLRVLTAMEEAALRRKDLEIVQSSYRDRAAVKGCFGEDV